MSSPKKLGGLENRRSGGGEARKRPSNLVGRERGRWCVVPPLLGGGRLFEQNGWLEA